MGRSRKNKGKPRALTAQRQRFFEIYLTNGRNGAAAYGAAVPASMKKSAQYRAKKAHEWLADRENAGEMSRLETAIVEREDKKFTATADDVLAEVQKLALFNASDLYEWGTRRKYEYSKEGAPIIDSNGEHVFEEVPFFHVKDSKHLTRDQMAVVVGGSESISKTGDRLIEVKVANKLDALDKLCKHFGLYKQPASEGGAALGARVQVGDTTITLAIMPQEANL